ncbi:MAG: hypothetical protein COW85_09560 [Ignavibacteria bacterium CG22_combo_CG10-13_8_21_14_all_37_15]|nr:MAG: hypothetical protein COW85_09560 [Ignavibacteria bacterium CG22_combo_CG10-13_8_21_14_all_37_15]
MFAIVILLDFFNPFTIEVLPKMNLVDIIATALLLPLHEAKSHLYITRGTQNSILIGVNLKISISVLIHS